MRHSLLSLAAASAFLILTGCASTSLDTKSTAAGGASGASATTDQRVVQAVTTGSAGYAPLPAELAAKKSVYFDFDSTALRPDSRPVLDAHARYLRGNPNRKVVIEGNTDEVGGREYNIALGQRRAEAVRRGLTLLGAADGQIEAISNGEEKPKVTGSDEASWAENRRADINYR